MPLYLHGVPTTRTTGSAFLARSGGIAPDLPGFGRSGKPGVADYTIAEYDGFIERFLETVGVERVRMVVHDWGAVGLAFAQRLPERVERLVVVNAVPFLPGYRWHRTARIWRTPVLGELAMGATNRFTLRLVSREANVTPGPMPDAMRRQRAATTSTRARSARSCACTAARRRSVLAAAGERLGEIRVPALVVWGMRDPYIPARFGSAYARRCSAPSCSSWTTPATGRGWTGPTLVERLVEFLTG